MIRKTTLLSGVAGALLFAAPAFAQDMPAEPPIDQPLAEQPAHTDTTVAPGAEVRAADGAALGVLEGAGIDATGQQTLQVRAPDGELREVPVTGARLDGEAVILAWTEAEFEAAPSVTDSSANVSGEEADLATEQPQPEPLPEPEIDE